MENHKPTTGLGHRHQTLLLYQLRGQLGRNIEFLRLARPIFQQSSRHGRLLCALQTFSSREHIPPPTARLSA
ncbi:hypothetical protein PBY51_012225 [Eleginops maclovinus]|uniref:Uncharacterized protein n=1 Tax=Eleginops maclovinus TaxID=56733 RepID=A0AAN8AM65_ELEMC|nr:hypothetical protein PBY51_012225 [Eleginops maclovinus]